MSDISSEDQINFEKAREYRVAVDFQVQYTFDAFPIVLETFPTVLDTFQTVLDTFQTVLDTFQTVLDTFQTVLEDLQIGETR